MVVEHKFPLLKVWLSCNRFQHQRTVYQFNANEFSVCYVSLIKCMLGVHFYSIFMRTLNFPIIRPLCNIAHLFECVAMFDFVKRMFMFRITTQPVANSLLNFGCFPIFLHHTFDFCGFGWCKD